MPPIYTEFNFCPICATKLEKVLIEGNLQKQCPACEFIHWGEYSVGVGGVLLQEEKGLFVQRAINPGRGRWTIPGGYVGQGEKITDAVVREMWEETGLTTEPVSILAIKDRPEDIPGIKHDIYIVFLLRYLEGNLCPDPAEVLKAGFYAPDECFGFDLSQLSLYVVNQALKYLKQGDLAPGFIPKDDIQVVGSLTKLFTLP